MIKEKLSRRVYINNLPLDVSHDDLYDMFKVFDTIEEVFIKIKTNEITGQQFILAFVTFGSILGFKRCTEGGHLYFKDQGRPLELLKSSSASPSSSDSGNLIVVSPPDLRPAPSRHADAKDQLNLGSEVTPQCNKDTSELRLPFVKLGPGESLGKDWMGNEIKEKFLISRIIFGDRMPYEYQRHFGKNKFLCSNIRMNFPIKNHRKRIGNNYRQLTHYDNSNMAPHAREMRPFLGRSGHELLNVTSRYGRSPEQSLNYDHEIYKN